jgi:hypothetical protein
VIQISTYNTPANPFNSHHQTIAQKNKYFDSTLKKRLSKNTSCKCCLQMIN